MGALLVFLLLAGDSASALDNTNCDGKIVDDSMFDETIVRDHTDSSYGALTNDGVRPLGGGEGYAAVVARPETGMVRTADELRGALAAAAISPSVIYVDDDAEIDLSFCAQSPTPAGCLEPRTGPLPQFGPLDCADFSLTIPQKTMLASGRGRNGSRGALLYSHTFTDCPLFRVQGAGVRITGLRLRGPDDSVDSDDILHCQGEASAIHIVIDNDKPPERWKTEIDNNELSGWPRDAVGIARVQGVRIHHNVVQYNRRVESDHTCGRDNYGLGYGVNVGPGSAVIEANVFDHNRHDIASDGKPGAHYTAIYNLVLNGAVEQSFDVHGGADRHDCTDIAGAAFVIHHNTFLQAHKPAVRMRGIPTQGAWMYQNTTRDSTLSYAFSQINSHGNFHAGDNRQNINEFPAWFISFGGSSFWQWRRFDSQSMKGLAVGDFDGDGAADVIRSRSNQWQWSRSARENWQFLNTSAVPVSELRLGDFAGDGKTDVVRDAGNEWQISESGTSNWQTFFVTPKSPSDAALGDFAGDDKTDALFADGQQWTIVTAFRPTVVRQHFNQPFKLSALRFGNFAGDSKIDVLRAEGGDWLVFDFGSPQHWVKLNSAPTKQVPNPSPPYLPKWVPVPLNELKLADFDGDGFTDIARRSDGGWLVSWRGTSSWRVLTMPDVELESRLIADFNGDRKADVMSRQSPSP